MGVSAREAYMANAAQSAAASLGTGRVPAEGLTRALERAYYSRDADSLRRIATDAEQFILDLQAQLAAQRAPGRGDS